MAFKKMNIAGWIGYSTCSIALLPALSNAINSICMMVWIFLVLLSWLQDRTGGKAQPGNSLPLFFIFGGNFLFLTVSLLYSTDRGSGSQFLVTELPMLLFPFGFFLTGIPLPDPAGLLKKVCSVFWFSTLSMSLWVFYNYWQLQLFSEFSKASSFNTILRETAEKVTDKHPDYLSLFLVFSIFIAAGRLFAVHSKIWKIVYGLSIPIFLYLLLLLAARSPIFALVAGTIVICFLHIKKGPARWLTLLGMTASFLLIIRFTPAIYSRVLETKNTAFTPPVGLQFNSTNIRAGIFQCTRDIIGQHVFLGIGAGSDKQALNACYARFPTTAYQITYYNTHDQYANFWLLSGVFSLLLFIASLIYALAISLRKKDRPLLFFIILTGISFLTENILSRQAGVVFYYFFICLMVKVLQTRTNSCPDGNGSGAAA